MKSSFVLLAIVGVVTTAILATFPERNTAEAAGGPPESAAAMAEAANRFLAALTPRQHESATFPFADAERLRWHFVPTEIHPRQGLLLRDMDEAQRALAHDLLRTGLSSGGYLTATAVIELEGILRDIEGPGARFARDPELYYFSIFGTPSPDGTWGWRAEGHHLSLHFTLVEGTWVATAPAFVGANPAEVREGPQRGLRILAEREDIARALLHSLDQRQRGAAIISTSAPDDILTINSIDVEPLWPAGIRLADLRPDQRDLLMSLIEVYASIATEPVAAARLTAIRNGRIDDIAFAWAGGTEPGQLHYYRIQGPTFLIEYDNTQNDANHIHSVWRDFDGDFGRDLLREHLAAHPH